jgi:hypothetical protein
VRRMMGVVQKTPDRSVCCQTLLAIRPYTNVGLLPRPCEILLEEGIWESTKPETVLFPSSHSPFAPEDTTK